MSDATRIQPYSLPAEFVQQWNESAADALIDAAEYRIIQQAAQATASGEDDRFLADLDTGPNFDFNMNLDSMKRRNAQLEAVAGAAQAGGLQFSNIKIIFSNANGYNRWTEYRRDSGMEVESAGGRKNGVVGGALGYSSNRVVVGSASTGRFHGVHIDALLSHRALSLGLLSASLRTQADLGFGSDGVNFVVGAGPMVHVGVPGLVQVYGGVLANGLVGSVNDKGRAGWAVNATAGVGLLGFYGELDSRVTGGDTRPVERFSIGFRGGF